MIRINLLGLKKEIKGVRAPAVSLEGAKLTGMVLGFLGLALAILAGHYYTLHGEAGELEKNVKVAEAEKADLAKVKAQYDENVKRKQVLKRKMDIFEDLKRGQTGPVEMLSALANTVHASETLWLTNFENTGEKVNIEGVAASVTAVADFIGNLKRSGYFKNVEIKESYQDDRLKELTSFIFQVSAELALRAAAAPSPAKPKT